MELLEFARGPGLALALALFLGGTAWRLIAILRFPVKPDYSQPRSAATGRGALRAIVSRMVPHAAFRERTLASMVHAYGYHLGLAIVFFGYGPHIAFIERLTGLTWPAVPGWLFALAVAFTFVGLFYALFARLSSPVLHLLSTFDDYFSWFVTLLPMLTGMALISLPIETRVYPASLANPLWVAIHLLSLELLLAWLPFGKLAHAFLVFFSRGATGAAFARKGAAL